MTGFLFCLAFAVTLAWAVCPWLGGAHLYRQFVVGTITLHGENKAGDYQALALVVVVFGAMAWLWQRSRRRFAAVSGEPAGISPERRGSGGSFRAEWRHDRYRGTSAPLARHRTVRAAVAGTGAVTAATFVSGFT